MTKRLSLVTRTNQQKNRIASLELYEFNTKAYNKLVELFQFRFYNQIKDTGIVFKEILVAENLVSLKKFYILVCDDQVTTHSIRFQNLKSLVLSLKRISENRLHKLLAMEAELMRVNDTEEYGENQYFEDTEITAIGISSIKDLLNHFDRNSTKWNK